MDLFYALPGDIMVAKIDLKNGAVAIVPMEWKNIVVTSHFAVYEPDRSKLLPEYFQRIIQTTFLSHCFGEIKLGPKGVKK
jgi:type I restriction enzyme S subunit